MKLRDKIQKEVRKVKSNGKTAIGMSPSFKSSRMVSYESSLENDFIAMAEFDPFVAKYGAQPVRINYKDDQGKNRFYTPDFLVYHKRECARKFPPTLVEVKYRSDIKKNWTDLKPKFKAAINYAASKKWKFKIMTEVEIRTEYMNNVKFLLPYRSKKVKIELIRNTIMALKYMEDCTPSELVVVAAKEKEKRLEIVNAIWHLISLGKIGFDHFAKLQMESNIWYKTDKTSAITKPFLYAKAGAR